MAHTKPRPLALSRHPENSGAPQPFPRWHRRGYNDATMARQGELRPDRVSDREWAEACGVAAEMLVSNGGDLPVRAAIKEALRQSWYKQ